MKPACKILSIPCLGILITFFALFIAEHRHAPTAGLLIGVLLAMPSMYLAAVN